MGVQLALFIFEADFSRVDLSRPPWITMPTARNGPVLWEAGRTMLMPSSAVV